MDIKYRSGHEFQYFSHCVYCGKFQVKLNKVEFIGSNQILVYFYCNKCLRPKECLNPNASKRCLKPKSLKKCLKCLKRNK